MQVYSALSGVKLCQWVKIDLNQNAEQSKHYRGKPSCMYSLDLRNFWEDFPRNTAIFPASPWCFARFCFSINYIHDGNRPAEFHSLWHRIQRVVMISHDNIQNSCIVFHPKLYSQRNCSLGDDGATNQHCQYRHGHQLQTVVTWVLDELERNQKKENHLKTIPKMMGTLVQVQLNTFSSRMALYRSGGEVVFTH